MSNPIDPTQVWVRLGTALVECVVVHARPDDYNHALAKPVVLLISGSEISIEYLAKHTGDWWLERVIGSQHWALAHAGNKFLHNYWLESDTATIPLHFSRKDALEAYSFYCFEEEQYYAKRRAAADSLLAAMAPTPLTSIG